MSLRSNSLPMLTRGTTFIARFWHYERDAMLIIRCLTSDAQVNIRAGKHRQDTIAALTVTNAITGMVFRDRIVRVELPLGGDALNPFTFIDCTRGQVAVEVLSPSRFVTQLQG